MFPAIVNIRHFEGWDEKKSISEHALHEVYVSSANQKALSLITAKLVLTVETKIIIFPTKKFVDKM